MIFSYFVFGYKNKPSMSLHPTPTPTPHVTKGIKSADSFWCLSKTRHQIPKTIQKHSFCKGGRFDDWSDWSASNPNTFWTNSNSSMWIGRGIQKLSTKNNLRGEAFPASELVAKGPAVVYAIRRPGWGAPMYQKGEDGLPGLGRSAKPLISDLYRLFAFGQMILYVFIAKHFQVPKMEVLTYISCM